MIQCKREPKIDFDKKIFFELKDAIKYENDVKFLSLINRDFDTLSDSIYSLFSLRSLYLSLNQIREFNPDICQLKELRILQVDNNSIEDWSILTCLKKIEILDLRSNNINYIPDGVSGMTSLKELNLSNNLLKELNEEIVEIKSLEVLRLDNTGLVGFPESLCNLKSLETLDLSFNEISLIPDEIKKLVNLRYLYLENTNVEQEHILDIQKLLPDTRIIW